MSYFDAFDIPEYKASRLLGIAPKTLKFYRQANKAPKHMLLPTGIARYKRADLEEWVARNSFPSVFKKKESINL